MGAAAIDWNDAYANAAHIPDGDGYPARWTAAARAFRAGMADGRLCEGIPYGRHPRQRFDLFLPEAAPKGLVVYIHGGYWMRFDKSFWSHLAAGAVASGFAVAMPSYSLCPAIRIGGIVAEAAAAIEAAAAMVPGSIHLAGHSAGGHLATLMMTRPSPDMSDAVP